MDATIPSIDELVEQPLAIQGGPKTVPDAAEHKDLFHWPIVTEEDEQAVLEVLRAGTMSGTDISRKFETEFAQWQGTKFALSYPNGTMALQAAMWAAGLRRGDEMICTTTTYWASALQSLALGAAVVFADIDPQTLCMDPNQIERHITPRTKAIMVVHYCGHPADMDAILAIAKKHNLKVIEDVSHAQGTLYKGKLAGSFGDVAAMSMMGGKSFAIGEGGMLVTNQRDIYEQAIACTHYERTRSEITISELKQVVAPDEFSSGLPLFGQKGRMNQTCAAMGRVQLKYYPQRIKEIQKAINRFWDLLEGVPGIRAHRPKDAGSTMGGWYNPLGLYLPEELDGLPSQTFVDAVLAEGSITARGCNFPLHLHPVFNEADVYGDGKPTRIAFTERDVRQPRGSLPVAEGILQRTIGIPYFKHDEPELITRYAAAFKKVAMQAHKLKG